MAVLLLAYGAKHTVVDKTMWTPLHHAMRASNTVIARQLIKAGACICDAPSPPHSTDVPKLDLPCRGHALERSPRELLAQGPTRS